MSAYTDIVDAARDRNGLLFRQVQRSVLYFAGYIGTPGTTNDQNDPPAIPGTLGPKRAWAKQVRLGTLSISEEYAQRLIPLVLENQEIAAGQVAGAGGVADSLVQQIVESVLPTIWNG